MRRCVLFRGARASRPWAKASRLRELPQGCFGETPKPTPETGVLPGRELPSSPYFFGVAAGETAAAPSSIPKVQCASIFLPSDFALMMTVHVLSRNFCVT